MNNLTLHHSGHVEQKKHSNARVKDWVQSRVTLHSRRTLSPLIAAAITIPIATANALVVARS